MVLHSQNDTELWRLVSRGDGIAFKLLFDAWWEKLYVYAYNRLRSEADAQDVVQEVMINLWLQAIDGCYSNHACGLSACGRAV